MAKVISLFNQKGGVGKTTTGVNFCACLAHRGKKVLAIDFDPQSNMTSGLGVDKNRVVNSIYNVLIDKVPIEETIIDINNNLSLVPASIALAGAEVEIASLPQRETLLKRRLAQILPKYDYIIIDCAPSLGMLPINALSASNAVLIPIQCEYYALEGVSQLINTVNLVKKGINPRLEIQGVLLTMFDRRTNLSTQVVDEVRSFFSEKVYNTIIPRNVRLAEAPSYGQNILEYDYSSKGSQAYMKFTDEFLLREEG